MKKFQRLLKIYPKSSFIVLFSVFSVILFLLIFGSVKQNQLQLQVGQPAEETIRASKTIENATETENKRQLAEEAVVPEYSFQADLKETQTGYIQRLFTFITAVNDETKTAYQEALAKLTPEQLAANTLAEPGVEEKIAALKKKFETVDENALAFYQSLPQVFFENIFSLSATELSRVEDEAVTLIDEAMDGRIRETNLAQAKQNALYDLQLTTLSNELQQQVRYLVNQGIVENEFYNEKRTEELQQQARDAVTPVMIYQGEIIVREGNQIDAKALEKIELLGMTKQNTSIFPLVALGMLLVFQVFIFWFLTYDRSWTEKLRQASIYATVMIASIAVMKLFQLFQTEQLNYIAQIFPVAFAPLVLTIFCNRRLGMLAAVFQMLFVCFLYFSQVGTTYLLVLGAIYLFSGTMATLVRRHRLATQAGRAFVWIILMPFLFNIIMVTYQGISLFDKTTLMTLLCGFAGSALAYLLSVGLHPYIELVLYDDSDLVLNELSNPNHPLLKELLEKAPGTYHHSMMVANLSANAVAEIGGRSLLTRVACYYHDIGKIKHPNFFVENLPNGAENPHNFLLPEDSKQIIFAHVTDGVKILEKYQMPQMVLDICWQHHGTTLMQFFYVKAKERNPEVTEADFRYPGPKPQTREAAVVSIADSCEAAVRAMDHPTPDKVKTFVHNIIAKRIADGQFDECDLTMKEIRLMEKSIVSGLGSTFHSRIKYPSLKSEGTEK
nr:HDIG domain-containing metalloprotein [Enterococcus timonensis]